MWPVGRGRGRGENRLPSDGRHLGSFVVVGSRLQPTTGQGSNLVHQSSPRPGTLIYACQEQEKKAQGTQAHSRPNTRNDQTHSRKNMYLLQILMVAAKKTITIKWLKKGSPNQAEYIYYIFLEVSTLWKK